MIRFSPDGFCVRAHKAFSVTAPGVSEAAGERIPQSGMRFRLIESAVFSA